MSAALPYGLTVTEKFIHAAGPGGQHVNKVATAVLLRVDLTPLPADLRQRLIVLAGRRVSCKTIPAGELRLVAQAHRSQDMNRADARARVLALLLAAQTPLRPRQATRPTRASVRRHATAKRHTSRRKSSRRSPVDQF